MSLRVILTCNIFIVSVFAASSNITVLNVSNFYHLVNNDSVWVVHFYSSKTNKDPSFAKEFALSADGLQGIVKFGNMDIGDDIELAKNFTIHIKSLPVVRFYGISNDGVPKEYTGRKTAKDLTESILKRISKKVGKQFKKKQTANFTQEVNDQNFEKIVKNCKEPWLVLFYAPWCVHCKQFEPIWQLLASNLEKNVKFASLDATANKITANEYQITQYPTLKLLPYENKSLPYTFDYTQDRTVERITSWVLEKLPGPQIFQITDSKVFQKHCMKQTLCVVSALPPIFDCQAKCRNNYLNTLKQLGEMFKDRGWGWVWTAAGAQKDLERILNIGGSGYPSLVVLNPVKLKYSVFKGAFTRSKIKDFLTDLAKINAVSVEDDVMKNIVNVKTWDGKDSTNELPDELYLHDTELGKKHEL